MLLLTESDVNNLLTIEEAIEALDSAFRAQGRGEATNRPRDRVRAPSGVTLQLLGADLETQGVIGFKAYTSSRQGANFMVALFSSASGELLALIEANRMGQLRTGAASGLATRYMARSRATTVGVYGSGYQAETQLEAVCAVRNISQVKVYSPRAESRQRYAAAMSERLGKEVSAANDPVEAADADIVITATTSREPVLEGEWLRPGTHVNAIGANMLARRELDDEVIRRADLVVVDSREQALREASDLVSPLERGWITWERIRELHQVVSGDCTGRTGEDQITLFKSLGLGLEDIAVGAVVYQKAREQGIGREVAFLQK